MLVWVIVALLLGLAAIACVIGGSMAESPRKNEEQKRTDRREAKSVKIKHLRRV